jgi:hypothetical protein
MKAHVNFIKSLPLLLAAAGSGFGASAQLVPITLTAASFNQDLVAESGSNPQTVTTAALDGSGNNIFYSLAFVAANSSVITSGGLPNNGVFTSGANSWQMTAYTGNNALFFGPESTTSSQSMHLSTPGQYSEISLLDAAGYGPTSVTITLNFSSGPSTSYGTYSILDWFGGTPYVANNLGRINRNSTVSNNNAPAGDPELYQTAISLNATDQERTLTSITILDNSTNNQATAAFFAVSGIATTTLALTELTLSGQYQSSGNVSGNTVALNWDATGATGPGQFDVQRSVDETTFTTIGSVSPDAQAVNAAYSYSDNTVSQGQTYFYRIAEMPSVGASLYSNIIQLQTAAAAPLFYNISQNAGTLYVNNNQSGGQTNFEVFGLSGQLYAKGIAPATSRFSIDLQSLAHGIYVIRLENEKQAQSIEFLR